MVHTLLESISGIGYPHTGRTPKLVEILVLGHFQIFFCNHFSLFLCCLIKNNKTSIFSENYISHLDIEYVHSVWCHKNFGICRNTSYLSNLPIQKALILMKIYYPTTFDKLYNHKTLLHNNDLNHYFLLFYLKIILFYLMSTASKAGQITQHLVYGFRKTYIKSS